MKWFKHDSDASRDAKLKRLIIRYGMEGYGLYWYCLELIAGNIDRHNLTFELEHDAEIIGYDTGIHHEKVQEMMCFMVDLGLFENKSGVISCIKMAKRLDSSMTSDPKLRGVFSEFKQEKQELRLSHDEELTESCKIRREQIRKDKEKADFLEIFDFWKTTMRKANNTKPTSDRRQKVLSRLRDGYPVDEIKRAITNCSKSKFHMGENDDRKVYDDLVLICRNGSNLERFRDMESPTTDEPRELPGI